MAAQHVGYVRRSRQGATVAWLQAHEYGLLSTSSIATLTTAVRIAVGARYTIEPLPTASHKALISRFEQAAARRSLVANATKPDEPDLRVQPGEVAALFDDCCGKPLTPATVLGRLPPTVSEFMVHTSAVYRFDARFCDALLDPSDSATVLPEAGERQSFSIPADGLRGALHCHAAMKGSHRDAA
ncbi:hypothetical protein ACQPXM_11710 [Kribbella sp. CA-253562]|uniref:hypothetical protein n=1 Tax=Kribbella sp. CA-253562 TaxID=3239942 RepID=UPI003D93A0EA